jgi:hypothetical protein
MTTFNQTITNSLNLFGPQDTNKWGEMIWGIDNWAYSQFDLPIVIVKLIDNTMLLDNTVETLYDVGVLLENSLALTNNMTDEYLSDENGWLTFFGNSTNAENRALTSYNRVTGQATAYTSVPRSTTSYTTSN